MLEALDAQKRWDGPFPGFMKEMMTANQDDCSHISGGMPGLAAKKKNKKSCLRQEAYWHSQEGRNLNLGSFVWNRGFGSGDDNAGDALRVGGGRNAGAHTLGNTAGVSGPSWPSVPAQGGARLLMGSGTSPPLVT